MSNPYQSPGLSSSPEPPPLDPTAFGLDATLRKLTFRRRACEIVLGCLLIPFGGLVIVSTIATAVDPPPSGGPAAISRIIVGATGTFVAVVGACALAGYAWSKYAGAGLAAIWLGLAYLVATPAPSGGEQDLGGPPDFFSEADARQIAYLIATIMSAVGIVVLAPAFAAIGAAWLTRRRVRELRRAAERSG